MALLLTNTTEVVCTGGSKSFHFVINSLSNEGDKFIDNYTGIDTISKITEWLTSISTEVNNYTIDLFSLFIGNNHGHLVAFTHGCHQYIINMENLKLLEFLDLIK